MKQATNNPESSIVDIVWAGFGLAGVIYGISYFIQSKDAKDCDPATNRILPQECLTPEFFQELNGSVKEGRYDDAVQSFLNPEERRYAETLGTKYDAEEHLVRRLALKPFLGGVELCGTPETPSCEELLIDPSCGCPRWDYSNAKAVIERVSDIRVQSGIDSSRLGKVEVRFDESMRYVVIDGARVTMKELPAGEPYLTTFTPHWDYNPTKK